MSPRGDASDAGTGQPPRVVEAPAPERPAAPRFRLPASIVAGTVVAVVIVLALSVYSLWRSRETLQRQAIDQAENLTKVLERDIYGAIHETDLALQISVDEYRKLVAEGRDAEFGAFLDTLLRREPQMLSLRAADREGWARHGAGVDPARPVDLSDRDHFRRARDTGFAISAPVMARISQAWVLPVARRLEAPNGEFAGVALANIAVQWFGDLFASLNAGPLGTFVVFDAETNILIRHPELSGPGGAAGRRIGSPEFKALWLAGRTQATYRARSTTDGVQRTYSYQQVGSYPLFIMVGLADEDVFAPWQSQVAVTTGFLAVLALLASTLLWSLRRALEQQRRTSQYARSLIEASLDPLVTISSEGKITDANTAAELVTGRARDELVGTDFARYFSDPDKAREGYRRVFSQGAVTNYPLAVCHANGKVTDVLYNATLYRDEAGEIRGVFAAARDVTALKEAEAQLRLAASVFANSYEGIVITDAGNRIVDVNPAFTRITGYGREEVVGRDPKLLASGRQGRGFYSAMWDSLDLFGFWRGEIWNRRKDGEVYAEMLSISVMRNYAGRVSHYIAVFSDISVIKRHEAELDRVAHYDTLTGIPNRRLLADRLGQAIARSKRSGLALAVCYLDLDGFKPVNDQLGHEAGDQLLIEITRRMRAQLRENDTLARLGGDEFALLISDLPQPQECYAVVERILATVAQPVTVPGGSVALTASIGVTLCPPDDPDGDILLRHADQAMYRTKEGGKNGYHLFDPDQDRMLRAHRSKQQRLRHAIGQDELVLHYQPKVDIVSGEVIGAEALLRWQHPEEGLLPPGEFLPYLDGTDLDVAIGEWVIESALMQLGVWHAAGRDLVVSVNISAAHLLRPDFRERLRLALARHPGIRPASLELEILETAALSDMEQAERALTGCRELGVRFALDDFGTGYSSLTYFRKLPVDMLKIDQSFVRDMLEDPNDLDIVESVIKLASAFNRPVIAEGVETLQHGELLVTLGCRLCQGYGIARPMPAERMPAWIDEWRLRHTWMMLDARPHRDDQFLAVAAQSHRRWVEQLVESLDNPGRELSTELDSRHCRFGRWYQGGGATRYGSLPEFLAIAPAHERVHATAAEILAQAQRGETVAAKARLPELYLARDHLLSLLDRLSEKIGRASLQGERADDAPGRAMVPPRH